MRGSRKFHHGGSRSKALTKFFFKKQIYQINTVGHHRSTMAFHWLADDDPTLDPLMTQHLPLFDGKNILFHKD